MSIHISYQNLPDVERNNMRILLSSPGFYQLCQHQIELLEGKIVSYNRDGDAAAIGAMYKADRVQLDFWREFAELCQQAAKEMVKS